MSTRQSLLCLLSDGEFHSGSALGEKLGLSRAAIWKQIHSLLDEGLLIESLHAKGYRLITRTDLLNKELILSLIPISYRQQIDLTICDELESTNQYLMVADISSNADRVPVCLAEKQSAGRGRRGRTWQTPYATGIAMSIRWKFESDASCLAGLSLAVGVAAAQVLEEVGIEEVKLKWPNDLVCGANKLGGILIEVVGDAAGPCEVVVGIGLNITNSSFNTAVAMSQIDQPWTDVLSQLPAGQPVSRNHIAANLIHQIIKMLAKFEGQGFAPYRAEFEQRDALQGQEVRVQHVSREIVGTACGVNDTGGLLLRSGETVTTITSGDVSVRTAVAQ